MCILAVQQRRILFEHEGSKLNNGLKYCIRTDVMYKIPQYGWIKNKNEFIYGKIEQKKNKKLI